MNLDLSVKLYFTNLKKAHFIISLISKNKNKNFLRNLTVQKGIHNNKKVKLKKKLKYRKRSKKKNKKKRAIHLNLKI